MPSGRTLCPDVVGRDAVTETQVCTTIDAAKFGLNTPPSAFEVMIDGQVVDATCTDYNRGCPEGQCPSGPLLVKEGVVNKHCCSGACSDASTCTAKTCNANRFDTNVVYNHSATTTTTTATSNLSKPSTTTATHNKPSCPSPSVLGSAPRWLVGADDGSHAEILAPVDTTSLSEEDFQRIDDTATWEEHIADAMTCPVFDGLDNHNEGDAATEDAVYVAEETVEIEVTMDSGAVDHVIGPKDLPANAVVQDSKGRRANRNFTAANGTAMNNYGEVSVVMEDIDTQSSANGTFAVTDVTRALHATSRIADNNCTIVFTKDECKVYKGEIRINGRTPLTTYRIKGGLYVRRVKLRTGRMQPAARPKTNGAVRPAAGFTGQGNKR